MTDIANLPPALKPIIPYLKQSQQLEKHDQLMAYYCRLHAIQMAMEIKQKLGAAGSALSIPIVKILDQGDADKAKLGSRLDEEDEANYVEAFAMKAFSYADTQDRAGKANKSTSTTFYSAFLFFNVLEHMGEVSEEVKLKKKYASWRSVDINNAIKNGETPAPPPSINQEDESPKETEEEAQLRQLENELNNAKVSLQQHGGSIENSNNMSSSLDLSFPSIPTSNSVTNNNINSNQSFPSFPSFPSTASNSDNNRTPSFPKFPTTNGNETPSFPSFPSTPTTNNQAPSFPKFPSTNNNSNNQTPSFPSFPSTPTNNSDNNISPSFPKFPTTNNSQAQPSFPSFPSVSPKQPHQFDSDEEDYKQPERSNNSPSFPSFQQQQQQRESSPPPYEFNKQQQQQIQQLDNTNNDEEIKQLKQQLQQYQQIIQKQKQQIEQQQRQHNMTTEQIEQQKEQITQYQQQITQQQQQITQQQKALASGDSSSGGRGFSMNINYTPTEIDKSNAEKYSKWVISSLQFDDTPSAIKNAKLSYKYLTGVDL